MKKQVRAIQNTICQWFEGPPLTRLQFAIAAVALFWVLPILILVALNWEPMSVWMKADKRAEWAAAIGSIAAAWAAVWAAIYPQRLRRAEDECDGAVEASTHRNAVGMVQADLVGLVRSYKITTEKLEIFRPAMQAARAATAQADKSKGNKLAELLAAQQKAEADFSYWADNLGRIGAKLDKSRLTLEAVPISIIRRYDFLLASDIAQGINQLHAAKGLFDRGATDTLLAIAIDATISSLNRFVRRVGKADEFVRRQSDKLKERQ